MCAWQKNGWMRVWFGDVHTVHTWTNRPVWPQGIVLPTSKVDVPKDLDWDLWQGTAQSRDYVQNLHLSIGVVGMAYGTGALGDMACHIMDAAFRILPIDFPSEVECSATTAWEDFSRGQMRDSCPASSIIHLKFPRKDGRAISNLLWWMVALFPKRPDELLPDEELGNGGNGYIFVERKESWWPITLPNR